jgi:hypothetical protein
MNGLFGDFAIILGLVEFCRPDKHLARRVWARRATTQTEMNELYEMDSDLYLPFRYQLTLKVKPALLPISSSVLLCKHLARRVWARRATTPTEMDELCEMDSNLYLPFRYQLTLKVKPAPTSPVLDP